MIKRTFWWGHGHVKNLWADSLYRNSFWLMAGTFTSAGVGFIYWILAARLYNPTEIGLATTFISAMTIVHSLAILGFGVTLIRYLPTSNKKANKINTAFTIVGTTSLIFGAIYLLGIPLWTNKLEFLINSIPVSLLVLLFFPINTLNAMTDSVFIAYKESQWTFISNIIQSVTKLFTLPLFIGLGAWGIISSNAIGIFFAVTASLYILSKEYSIKYKLELDKVIINHVKKFAISIHVTSLIGMLPPMLVPIIITNRLAPDQTAYFYMPNMIATLFGVIPTTIARSYFTENSHKNQISSMKKPLLFTYALLAPALTFIIFIGPQVLSLFGKSYATEGSKLLILLIISILISVINIFLSSQQLIKHNLFFNALVQAAGSVLYICLISLYSHTGIESIGYSAIIMQLTILFLYIVGTFK